MVDVNKLRSHPTTPIFEHVNGVVSKVQELTNSKIAKLAAIFHDLGKINPNFQLKLDDQTKIKGYANHAYLSAFAFAAFCQEHKNLDLLRTFLGAEFFTSNYLVTLIIIIAKHHGHLLDYCPKDHSGTKEGILNAKEINQLYLFLKSEIDKLPATDFVRQFSDFINCCDFDQWLLDSHIQYNFKNLSFENGIKSSSLDFFLDTQFAFASLIYADKTDAADFKTIKESPKEVEEFCKIYSKKLNAYLDTLKPDSDLNKWRTAIRLEAVSNIEGHLKNGKRVFELTSPTGSGKTLILLSLAAKIIKQEERNLRIIYALPFLSITEQVEAEVLKIFKGYEKHIQRIDSKSKNQRFEEIQEKLDSNPDDKIIQELGTLIFQEQVFAYPFIITTFVRFFETLLSNRNATLIKLSNFSKCIFLLDEIQSLPPRLYTFFVAYLSKFCEKFDSYAVISTATQPKFSLPQNGSNTEEAKVFFSDYQCPTKLLEHEKHFAADVFNRYQIQFEKNEWNLEQLKKKVLNENSSVLVILNTIDDSKDFYNLLIEELSKDELILLNTHFTPNNRKRKIKVIKSRLTSNQKIIAISTQLIEAGVDIDFPVLYRDFAPVSSIIQSAGRCNRNGQLDFGRVVLFTLRNKKGNISSSFIYGRGKDKEIWNITKDALYKLSSIKEDKLLDTQSFFFDSILERMNFAQHFQTKGRIEFDFIKDISDCMFKKIGKFQLIDEQDYGEAVRYYVAIHENDKNFELLQKFNEQHLELLQKKKKDYEKIVPAKSKVQNQLKKMSGNIVQVRIKRNDSKPLVNSPECLGIYEIDPTFYSDEKGLILNNLVGII